MSNFIDIASKINNNINDKSYFYKYCYDIISNEITFKHKICYKRDEYIEYVLNMKNKIKYEYCIDYIRKIGIKLNTDNINDFQNYIFYTNYNLSYFNVQLINIYKYKKSINDYVNIIYYIYFCYVQCLLNFVRIDYSYYYSFTKGIYNFYNINKNDINTYHDIIQNQINYVDKLIMNYEKLCKKFFIKWIDYVLNKVNNYKNSFKLFNCTQSKTKYMYSCITNINKYSKEYQQLVNVLYLESDILLILENKYYNKNREYFNNLNCDKSQSIQYIESKKELFNLFFQYLSINNPTYIVNEYEDFENNNSIDYIYYKSLYDYVPLSEIN